MRIGSVQPRTAQRDCSSPPDVWIPNANAVFFNTNRKAPVAATAIGVVFTDDGLTFRGKKPAEERGFTLTSCDVQVDGFPVLFEDVGVKISPS